MAYIAIDVMIKDGGLRTVKISKEMLVQLAESIRNNGSEWLTLLNGPIQVVGFMVIGKQTGERVIVLGSKDTESSEPLNTDMEG